MIKYKSCKNLATLIYLTPDEMDIKEAGRLSKHLESCSACREKHEAFLKLRHSTIQGKYPIVQYPDFTFSSETTINTKTADILIIKDNAGRPHPDFALRIFRYASSIAAFLLIILFAGEQSLSVSKIKSLENRIQTTIPASKPGLIDRLTMARASLPAEWTVLTKKLNINSTINDPADLIRIKSILESRFRSYNTKDLAMAGITSYSFKLKKQLITINTLLK